MQDLRLPNDYECEGQMNIYDYLEESRNDDPVPVMKNDGLVAVSKVFASALKQMNLAEWKTFILCLTNIKWKDKNKEEVYIDKKYLAECIGINSDYDHLSANLKRLIGELPAHSMLKFESADGKKWKNGCFIVEIESTLVNLIKVTFRKEYMSLFQELGTDNAYITMWADDLFNMSSERAILLYENLRLNSDTRKENSKIYGIKEMKKLFDIPKDGKGAYMRKDGHFDRPAFEKRVIDKVCKDMEQCQMLTLTVNEDGKLYRKVKNKHGNVVGYEFQWVVSDHPRTVTAKKVKQLNQNPQVLKVASDIVTGKENPKKKKQQNTNNFMNFESVYENEDFSALEQQLLDN